MRPKLTTRILFAETVAALLVLLFLYTALSKLQDITRFARSMLHSPVIADYHVVLSIIVPTAELVTTALLIIPRFRRLGLLASTLLMTLFTAYVGYVLAAYPTNLPCTCGGVIEQMNWREHLAFNIFFTLISLAAWLLYPKRFVRANRSSRIPV